MADRKLYVCGLPETVNREQLEEIFGHYGRLRDVRIPRGRGFAFVDFEDSHDAADAIRGLNGTQMFGNRVRVELANRSMLNLIGTIIVVLFAIWLLANVFGLL